MFSTDTSPSINHFHTIVIGAGVVGLAIARRFAMAGCNVLLLEKESHIGQGISSRNSQVIHSGLYYPPNSLKASLCVQGKEMLYHYCSYHNIPYKKIGKLIVATNEQQRYVDLPKLLQRGKANQVNDLILLSSEQVIHEYEPNITCHGAIYSPSTGIIDVPTFMMSLLTEGQHNNGVTLVLRSHVQYIHPRQSQKRGFEVIVDDTTLTCDILCNSTGLYSDLVSSPMLRSSKQVSHLSSSPSMIRRQYFAKGNYFRLRQLSPEHTTSIPFRHLIYPVPERFGLGIHATLDVSGTYTLFGPDVEWIPQTIHHPDHMDYSVDARRADAFYSEIRKYWPHLQDSCLVPDYSGIRPKLVHAQESQSSLLFQDFGIELSKNHGIPGFINLRGIESPGLTSCLAIAEYVFRHELQCGSMTKTK